MNCPDCRTEIKEVTVERFQTKTFIVNHEKKCLEDNSPSEPWDAPNDYCCHCPNCDSLNVDGLLAEYEIKED